MIMKYTFQKIGYYTLGIMLILSFPSIAQKTYKMTAEQELKVEGTSTLHDWEMVSSKAEGNGSITIEDGKIVSISSLKITLPVNSLKSGKSAMDKNAYKALNANEHQQIRLDLTKMESASDNLVRATCQLSISGTTNMVTIEADYNVTDDTISFLGSFPITFTQFQLDPPKAMFGTIKTGDELQVSFETFFKSVN